MKLRTPSKDSSYGRTRRWRVPPPLTRGGELLEGVEVLNEVPGETALLLWKSLRNVLLWSNAAPHEQAGLFPEGAQSRRFAEILAANPDPELSLPLGIVAQLLARPTKLPRETLANACRQIAQWAGAHGASATELAFIQAAALACPADADLAYHVGRLARLRGENARAESWYRRTIMLGRQANAWDPYARAYIALGNLNRLRGNLPGARRSHIKALRVARRHGMKEMQAFAYHDLLVDALEGVEVSVAQTYAEEAFRAYGPAHPNIPVLAHDVTVLWLREGQFNRALPVLQALAPKLPARFDPLLIFSNMARAAGGAGNRPAFEDARSKMEQLLMRAERPNEAQALFNLARGASSLKDWAEAADTAQRALEIASAKAEAQLVFQAEALLDQVRGHIAAGELTEQGTELVQQVQETEPDPFVEEVVESLTADLVSA